MAGVGELEPGGRLGPYRLDALLGEGAVGLVFRAVREPDGSLVALKVLRSELTGDETYRRRFEHEARAASEVRHKHLVPIVEAGEVEGRSYLAVAYVEGRTLADRLDAEGALPMDDAIRLVAQAAAGLDALHHAGIVHRDVKPSNVMIDVAGSASLTDFGLAKGRAYTVLTRPGQVLGTLDYLAPEIVRGEDATPASDIYALGCVTYECLAGRPPFADKSLIEIVGAHLSEEPPDPCEGRSDAPEGFGWTVLQAMAKDPTKRPPTATAYAHMVALASGRGSLTSP